MTLFLEQSEIEIVEEFNSIEVSKSMSIVVIWRIDLSFSTVDSCIKKMNDNSAYEMLLVFSCSVYNLFSYEIN